MFINIFKILAFLGPFIFTSPVFAKRGSSGSMRKYCPSDGSWADDLGWLEKMQKAGDLLDIHWCRERYTAWQDSLAGWEIFVLHIIHPHPGVVLVLAFLSISVGFTLALATSNKRK